MAQMLAGRYFERHAQAFDSIYDWRAEGLKGLINRWLRKDMFVRFQLTFEQCHPLAGKRVLDVGCGSGRYAVEFATRGASKVVGVDVAPAMVELSRKRAREHGVEEKCQFVASPLEDLTAVEGFDYAVAIGLFDYFADPLGYLRRIRELTRERVVATFPAKWRLRVPLRKLRLWLKGCPVYFYSSDDIRLLFERAGFASCEILYSGQIYVVSGRP